LFWLRSGGKKKCKHDLRIEIRIQSITHTHIVRRALFDLKCRSMPVSIDETPSWEMQLAQLLDLESTAAGSSSSLSDCRSLLLCLSSLGGRSKQ
jgi:hypothetical protein